MELRKTALDIFHHALDSVKPHRALRPHLSNLKEKHLLVAVGKAAWDMARAVLDIVPDMIARGLVITKEGHSKGELEKIEIHESAHPVPDGRSLKAAEKLIDTLKKTPDDIPVLFLLSGGASALVEKPKDGVKLEDIIKLTDELMRKGADIYELNAVRKGLSAIKGGKLASMFPKKRFLALVVSDVIGDRLDVIGSGPLHPDSRDPDPMYVIERYSISLEERLIRKLKEPPPTHPGNVEERIIANLSMACEAALKRASELGFNSTILSTEFQGEAREMGRFLGQIAREEILNGRPLEKACALIAGGETVVKVKGEGKGGRNQELALSASMEISGLDGVVIASIGTDGTDGPTDAAGAIVDGYSVFRMKRSGVDPRERLIKNDSYNALKVSGDLVFTGPTGTNVNDLMIILCQ